MKNKIGWWILLGMCFYLPQLSGQVELNENKETKFIRYGFGFSTFGNYSDLIAIDFELGYHLRLGEHFSTAAFLNFGFAPEDVIDIAGLQANLSLVGFVSPSKNSAKFGFKVGGGPSTLAAYDSSRWNETATGVFTGYCVVVESSYFNERKNKRSLIKGFFGKYTSDQSLIGLGFISQISIAQMKRDRERQKRKLLEP